MLAIHIGSVFQRRVGLKDAALKYKIIIVQALIQNKDQNGSILFNAHK